MTDTSAEIKKLQLAIWLAKSPGERLNQFLINNEVLYQFWDTAKPTNNPVKQVVISNCDNNKQ